MERLLSRQPAPARGQLWHSNRCMGRTVEVVDVIEGKVYFQQMTPCGGGNQKRSWPNKAAAGLFNGSPTGYTYLRLVRDSDYE